MTKSVIKPRLFQNGKDKPRLTTEQKRAARRVRELSRVYYRQFPRGLPHNGVGVKYAKYMLRTMAFLPDDRREQWLDQHAPWIEASTRDYFLRLGAYWYADRSLGGNLELDDETREDAQAWSLEVHDITKEQRQMINLEKDRKAKEKRRRKAGAKPHEQSLSRTQPWKDEGISRRTWERRRKAGDADSSGPFLFIRTNDESASKPESEAKATVPPEPSVAISGNIRTTDIPPSSGNKSTVLSLAEFLAKRKALAERLQRVRRSTGDVTTNLRWAA